MNRLPHHRRETNIHVRAGTKQMAFSRLDQLMVFETLNSCCLITETNYPWLHATLSFSVNPSFYKYLFQVQRQNTFYLI